MRTLLVATTANRTIGYVPLTTLPLALDQKTFRDMAHAYPIVDPLRELRARLSQLRLEQLAVGKDGRNRAKPPLLPPRCAPPLHGRSRATSCCNRQQQGAARLRRAAVRTARRGVFPRRCGAVLRVAGARDTDRWRRPPPSPSDTVGGVSPAAACSGAVVVGRTALDGAVQAVRCEAPPSRPFFYLTVRVSWSILRRDHTRSRCWRWCRASGKRMSARCIP